jgi:hypothetical protein
MQTQCNSSEKRSASRRLLAGLLHFCFWIPLALHATDAGTSAASAVRMGQEQLLAALPKTLGAYHMLEIRTYQDMADLNRLEQAYNNAKRENLDVEVHDTGGFTESFIKSRQYLRLPIGKLTINKYEVSLLEGNRALVYVDRLGHGNTVELAFANRFEIRVTSKVEDFDTLKKFALEIASRLK